ncbi:hypothetical protein STAL104432_00010 [Streptomyces albus]
MPTTYDTGLADACARPARGHGTPPGRPRPHHLRRAIPVRTVEERP